MTPEQIQARIINILPDAMIEVEVEKGTTSLQVVSQRFAGRGQLERQRYMLSLLKRELANGSLHIGHLKLYSTEEWELLKPGDGGLCLLEGGSWSAPGRSAIILPHK